MLRTLAVDGQNLLKMSFHGNKTTYSKWGYIGCIITFLTIVRKVIKEQQINKVIIFWDGPASGKLRFDIYPDYKANRNKNYHNEEITLSDKDAKREEDADQSLLIQKIRIQQYCEEFFFRQMEDPICEADDCLAHYVNNCMEPEELVIIYSNDRDFCQLVSDNVWLYIANKRSIVSAKSYFLEFPHHHANAALIKAIEGCSSDNIHGIDGIGEKTLLKHMPELKVMPVTFDYILDKAREIQAGRKKPLKALENLLEGKTSVPIPNCFSVKHLLELNYKLVNLKEPMLTEDAIETIEQNTTAPISDADRGGKNILRLMYEDGLIQHIPGGPEGYNNFLITFLPVVKEEKNRYQRYLREI